MKVTIIEGKHKDENIQKAYQYLVELYKKEVLRDEFKSKDNNYE
ncbi:MAG TPA: hypothetical protein VEY70_19790 [Metabacillus sp.]|nr:hypothetical protein [Metabacillus sp.]